MGRNPRPAAACAVGVAVAAALAALAGWAAGEPALYTFGGHATTTPLTAMICLTLAVSAGAGLATGHRAVRVVRFVVAVTAGAAAGVVLAEHLLAVRGGLESVLWPVEQDSAHPGRPSLQTTVALVCLAVGEVAAASGRSRGARVAVLAGAMGGTLGVLGFGGQLVAVTSLFSSAGLGAGGLAYPTAAALTALGVAVVITVLPRLSEATRGSMRARRTLRRLLPAVVAVPMLVAVMWGLVHANTASAPLGPLTVAAGIAVLMTQVWRTAIGIASADQEQLDFVEALPDGVLSVSGDRLTYTNPAFRAVLGDDPALLGGTPALSAVFSGRLAELGAAIEDLRRAGDGTPAEVTVVGADSATRVLMLTGRRISETSDAWIGVVQDISVRARVERELAAANAALRGELGEQAARLLRYRAVVESSPNAILTKTPDGIIADWNPAAERLYGYSVAEATGRPVSLIVPADRRTELADLLDRVRRGETVQDFETVRVARSGQRIDVALTICPLVGSAGEVVGASTTSRDLTNMREQEERFRVVSDAAAAGLLIIDTDGRIVLANAEAERQFGYTRAELDGMAVDRLLPPLGPEPEQDEPIGRRKDGGEFPVELALRSVHVGRRDAAVVSIVDTTERKRTQRELQDKNRELERSNRELEEFAYVASHDLQEPLRMMVNYTELLAERYRGQLDERADRYIGFIVDGGHRMRQLIHDLLVYSRAGTRGNAPAPTDLAAVVRGVLSDLGQVIEESGARVEVAELPTVVVDGGQLGQVFQNLIMNAVKFRSDTPPHIAIAATRAPGAWELSVTDNGIGIDPEYAEQIFHMFRRLHERGAYEGSGIGLAVVRRIVERHGGRVWCEPGAGGGTAFRFTVPADLPAPRERRPHAGDRPTGGATPARRERTEVATS